MIDLVYGSRPTPLVGTTRARQQLAIDGRDVLVTHNRQFVGFGLRSEHVFDDIRAREARPPPAPSSNPSPPIINRPRTRMATATSTAR